MGKRYIALLICICILCFGSVGCFDVMETSSTAPTKETIPMIENEYIQINSTHAYDNLQSKDQEKCYKEILTAASDVDGVGKHKTDGLYLIDDLRINNVSMDDLDLEIAFTAVLSDHPELFWVSYNYDYSIGVDNVIIYLYAHCSKSQIKTKIQKIEEKTEKIISGIPKNLTDYQVEVYIHDYLVDNCKYYDNKKEHTSDLYDTLIKGKTVCRGYTKAFQYLLNKVGIECLSIRGDGDGESHMWNAVLLDKDWYYVDVTWDDVNKLSRYSYFNITEEQLLTDHTIYPFFDNAYEYNVVEVNCDSLDYNYFYLEASQLTSFDNNTIVEDLVESYNNNEKIFCIYINPDYLDYDAAVTKMLDEYYLYNCIQQANNEHHTNISYKLEYLLSEQVNGLTITLK